VSGPSSLAHDAELESNLLGALERAFALHGGGRATLELADVQRALGLRSEYLARRVVAAFDLNADGQIQKEEFLAGVRTLLAGSAKEKLAFAFRVWDHDGDGKVSREDLHRIIALGLAESVVEERVTQPSHQLADALLAAADTDRDGRLSLDELERAVQRFPGVLERMTRADAAWIAPNEDVLVRLEGRPAIASDAEAKDGRRATFLAVWLFLHALVLLASLTVGRAAHTADPVMRLARALGAVIDFDAAFLFLPVMRRLLTALRPTWLGRVLPIDDAIDFHKVVGHTLFAVGLAHGAAFALAYGGGHGAAGALGVFSTTRGLTGAVLTAVFAVMWAFAQGFVRRSKRFELFYFTHLLYVAWLALLALHGPRILVFSGIAIGLFVLEQLARARHRSREARVVRADALRSGVTRLELERPSGFAFRAGDYVFLRVPSVARHEWHPFTISSAPESPNLTFHVRSLGNWTSELRRRVEAGDRPTVAFVDGPYGSPSAHIFEARFPVLIGAGIGVTPFASVLESLLARAGDGKPGASEKVHFFWLNRDQYSFEWFRGLLSRLEARDARGLLDIHLCMTGGKSGVTALGLELSRAVMEASGRSDAITGLRTRTHLGAPDWEKLLGDIAKKHAPARVEVFFCGPHGLARTLAPLCHRLGMTFREEKF
jgi:predicted ferric reductase/Ca2+-binding EF-hand superfamily protein